MIALLIPLLAVLSSCNDTAKSKTGNDIYPQGKKLLFSAYTLREPELDQAKVNGFTAIGPYYGRDKLRSVNYAQRAGLPLIYSVGPKIDFAATTIESDGEALAKIGREIRELSEFQEIAIWNLGNEELRHWRPREMAWLEKVTAVIRANDPYDRPVMMYEPNHRRSEQLVKTGRYLDFVSKGSYVNYAGMKSSRSWLRWSIEQSVNAAKTTGGTPIALLWMARDQKSKADVASIGSWVRHDVYLSLISGAKGIIVFSAFNKRRGFQKHFDDFFGAYAETARELNITLNLGQVFLFGKPVDDMKVAVNNGPAEQSFTYQNETHTYPSIHQLHIIHEKQHYLFIINSANLPVAVSVSGYPTDALLRDVFSGENIESGTRFSLEALEVKGIGWR